MDPNDETDQLKRRVTNLEWEVQYLRKRMASLEGAEGVAKETAAPVAPVTPPAPVAPAVPPPVATPPPVPPVPPATTAQPTPPPIPRAPVAPKPPRPPVAWPPAQPEQPSPIEKALRVLHLLPPKGEGSSEVQLGAWWATRIGAIVFVIGVVFAGVYLTLETAPWVKLAELAAVSVGVCLGGWWLERKLPQFGSVILGAGLALIYFTAFAAYAVPAVKVVDNLFVAGGLQVAAVLLILGTAVGRKSPIVATMAVLLGYVSAFSSLSAGFDDYAVMASLAMVAICVVFRLRQGWAVPLGVCAVLNHGLYMLVAWLFWGTEANRTSPLIAFSILGLGFGAILASVLVEHRRSGEPAAKAQRWVQALNTSLAVLAGLVAAAILLPDGELSWYFFGAGAVLAGVATYIWLTVPEDRLFGMFAVKASGLIALGVATEWGTRTRWLALAVEAFVLLAAGKRTRRPVLYITAVAAWSAAMYFYADDVWSLRGALLTPGGLAAAVFAIAAPVFWLLTGRWWPSERGTLNSETKGIFAVIAALPLFLYGPLFVAEPWGALGIFSIAVILAAIARWARSIIPLAGSVVAFVFSQFILHTFESGVHGLGWMWASVAVLAVASGAVGWYAAEIKAPARESGSDGGGRITAGQLRSVGVVFQTLALAAVFVGMFEMTPVYEGFGFAAGISAIVVCIAVVAGRSVSAAAGVFALAVSFMMALARLGSLAGSTIATEWLWVVAAAAPIAMHALGGESPVRKELENRSWFSGLMLLCLPIGMIALPVATVEQFGVLGFVWTMVVAGIVYFAIGVTRRIGLAFAGASIVLAYALFTFAVADAWKPSIDGWWALISALAATFVFGTLPVLTKRYAPWVAATKRPLWSVAQVVLGTLCIIRIATESSGPWASYGSVVWALGGIGLFAFGLFFRARPHRIAGLVTLALCIPRVFLVDINSTLYRIAAFVVLGVVLLWVGFSYQRFRHFIEDKDDAATSDDEVK